MMDEAGGATSRRGQDYQNYAAAYFFLSNESATELQIERFDSDFAFFYYKDEFHYKHFFEIKSREKSHFTWSNFKNEVVDEFGRIIKDHVDSEVAPRFHLVTNTKLNRSLHDFYTDIKRLQEGNMSWSTFESQHGRTKVEAIKQKADIDDHEVQILLANSCCHEYSKKELITEIEEFLRKRNPVNYRKPARVIKQMIEEVDSGVITKRDFEKEIEFSLTKFSDTTSAEYSDPEEQREAVSQVKNRHSSADVDITSPVLDKQKSLEYAEAIQGRESTNNTVVESLGTRIEERFSELEEIRVQERGIRQEIGSDLEDLLDMDDSTSSEEEDD